MTVQIADAASARGGATGALETRRPTSRASCRTSRPACSPSTSATACAPRTPAAVILQQPLADLHRRRARRSWGRHLPALASFAELVNDGFHGDRDGPWQKEAQVSVGATQRDAAGARHAPARRAGARLRRGVRRHHAPHAGAARRGVGRGRAPPRARDQESAHADPAFGRAPAAQARGPKLDGADAEVLQRATGRSSTRCRR